MNAIAKRIWQLVPRARNTICTRRSAIFQITKNYKILIKSGNANTFMPTTSFIQCRFQSSSRSDNAHQITLIREWNDIGKELLQQRRWSEALEAANQVLKIDANNYRALTVKSVACYCLKQYQAALDCTEILLANGAASADNFLTSALIRCQFDQYDEALEDVKQSRKLFGKEENTYFWSKLCEDHDNFGPRSIELLRRALKDFRDESDLYYALAVCYFRSHKFSEAKEFIQSAFEMEPDNPYYLMIFGGIELNLKNFQQAAQLLDKSVELGLADREDLWQYRLEAGYQMGNPDEMEKCYYIAFEHIKPSKLLINNALALAQRLHETHNESERAIKLIEKVINSGHEEMTPLAEKMRADTLIEVGRLDEAAVAYRKLHERDPNNSDITFTYAALLEPKDALPYFEELSRTHHNDIIFESLGKTYRYLSLYEKGIEALNKAIAIKETMSKYHILAECYANLRQHQKEYQALLRACELAANDEQEENRVYVVLPLVARWQYKQALQELDKLLTKNPNVFDAWNLRATTLKELGRETEALEAIEKAINIDPHIACYLQKVDILATFGRSDEAFEVLKHAETLLEHFERYQPIYHLTFGVALSKQGRYEEALEYLEKSTNSTAPPDMFTFQRWMEKAKTLEALKRTDEAIANYEYVLSIFSEEPHSLLHLAKLYHSCGLNSKALALVPRLAALKTDIDSFNNEVAEFLAQMK